MPADMTKGRRTLRVLLLIIGVLAALSTGVHLGSKRLILAHVDFSGPSLETDRIVQLLGVQTWLNAIVIGCLVLIGVFVLRPIAEGLDSGTAELEKMREERDRDDRQDALTGLPDRRHFGELLGHDLARGARHGHAVGLIRIGLRGLREANARLGGETGDRILADVAARVRDTVRASDYVARIGDGEFAIVVPVLRTVEGMGVLADRLVEALDPALRIAPDVGVHCGIGIAAAWPSDTPTRDQLMSYADEALVEAQSVGKSTWRYHASAIQGLTSRFSVIAS